MYRVVRADHRNGGVSKHRLTTEMGECGGWENSTGMPTPAKMTLNVPYWLTTEMGECGGIGQVLSLLK